MTGPKLNSAQATVAGGLRLLSIAVLLWFLGSLLIWAQLKLQAPPDFAAMALTESGRDLESIDFAGGTVVHFNWASLPILFAALLGLIFPKKIAVLITPNHS